MSEHDFKKTIADSAFEKKRISIIHSQLVKLPQKINFKYMVIDLGSVHNDGQAVNLIGVLICPSRSEINQHLTKANEQCANWAKKHGLADEKSIKRINNMHFAGVTSTSLAHTTLKDAEIIADCTTFFAILDDIWDEKWTRINNDIPALHTILTVFIDILRGNYQSINSVPSLEFPLYSNFCSALFDIRQRLNKHNISLKHFIGSVEDYFQGYILGYLNRKNQIAQSELSYFNIRKYTLGAQTAFELCLSLQGYNVDEKIRRHPIFDMIIAKGLHALALLNDIISMSKELSENKPENIILLKYQHAAQFQQKNSKNLLQTAFDAVIDVYNAEMLDLIRLHSWLTYFDKAELPALEAYYQIVTHEIRDNLDYYLTPTIAKTRYGLKNIKHREISIDNISQLEIL